MRKNTGIAAYEVIGVAAGVLVGVALITRFSDAFHWLWTDTGFVFQLILGVLITWVIFWFIRRMHPEQPVGEVIRHHFSTSRKLGLGGITHFLGEPLNAAIDWLCYQGTCWLVAHFPRAGAAWVELTRPLVTALRREREAYDQEIAQRIADYDREHGE